jgi:predicted O-methyltransferase YrrM
MIKQLDTKHLAQGSCVISSQMNDFFSSWEDETKAFDQIWDEWFLHQSVLSHLDYGGVWAGSGTLDYNEARVLYTLLKRLNPKNVLEIGVAQGVSGSLIRTALDPTAKLTGVDIQVPTSVCEKYLDFLKQKEIVFYQCDAIEFVKQIDQEYDFIFVDADHYKEFCCSIASALKEKYPRATIVYHEWAFSAHASNEELVESSEFISQTQFIRRFWERKAFEDEYWESNYSHFGFYGSCGLGVVIDNALHATIKH